LRHLLRENRVLEIIQGNSHSLLLKIHGELLLVDYLSQGLISAVELVIQKETVYENGKRVLVELLAVQVRNCDYLPLNELLMNVFVVNVLHFEK
jgi:hypothetical protein